MNDILADWIDGKLDCYKDETSEVFDVIEKKNKKEINETEYMKGWNDFLDCFSGVLKKAEELGIGSRDSYVEFLYDQRRNKRMEVLREYCDEVMRGIELTGDYEIGFMDALSSMSPKNECCSWIFGEAIYRKPSYSGVCTALRWNKTDK